MMMIISFIRLHQTLLEKITLPCITDLSGDAEAIVTITVGGSGGNSLPHQLQMMIQYQLQVIVE